MDSSAKTISTGTTAEPAPLRALILRVSGVPVVRFLFVSTISTVVDYAVLFILNGCLPQGWTFLAVAAGYLIGTLVNFVMARRMVFRPSGYHTHIEFVLVAAVAAVGLGLTEWITLALSKHQHWHLLLAKTVAVVIVFFWNFFARRLLIYRTADKGEMSGDPQRHSDTEGKK